MSLTPDAEGTDAPGLRMPTRAPRPGASQSSASGVMARSSIRRVSESSKWQRLVHPVVRLQHLLAVETRHVFGLGLRALDEPLDADGAAEAAEESGVADEEIVFQAAE